MFPRTLQIMQTYWDQLKMVAKAGGYFGPSLKGYRGVTLSSKYFKYGVRHRDNSLGFSGGTNVDISRGTWGDHSVIGWFFLCG